MSDVVADLSVSIRSFVNTVDGAQSDESERLPENLNRNALAVVLALLSQSMDVDISQAVSLSHIASETSETPVFVPTGEQDGVFEQVDDKNAKPEFKSPKSGSSQEAALEWLLSGASDLDGDADHYENDLWYIKRILMDDKAISINMFAELASRSGVKLSRATAGRLLKMLKEGEYNEHIMQRCHDMGIEIGNVFPGKSPKAEYRDNAWVIVEG